MSSVHMHCLLHVYVFVVPTFPRLSKGSFTLFASFSYYVVSKEDHDVSSRIVKIFVEMQFSKAPYHGFGYSLRS